MLGAYSLALKPWAERVATRMLNEVNARDLDAWRNLSQQIGMQLRRDIASTPVGTTLRSLLGEQVELITSLPTEAAERVHRLTIEGLQDSTRAGEIAKEILRSGSVTESRATLIARTEVSRTASSLTEARATSAGLPYYTWRTADDADVRPGHAAMEGKVCEWANPPAVIENGKTMYFHPGTIWNCRCWAEPVVPTS